MTTEEVGLGCACMWCIGKWPPLFQRRSPAPQLAATKISQKMSSFAQEELERYKHEAILEHKEALIEKLKGDLKNAERRLKAATNSKGQAKSNTSQGLSPKCDVELFAMSPGNRRKAEASMSRDEKFAYYAAIARSKVKANKLTLESIRDYEQQSKVNKEYNVLQKKLERQAMDFERNEKFKDREHERRLKEKEREKNKTDFRRQYIYKLNENRSTKKEIKRKEKNLEKRERDQIKIEIQHQKERRQCMKRAHKAEQDTLEKEYQRLLRLLQTKEYSITRARVNNRSLKNADPQ